MNGEYLHLVAWLIHLTLINESLDSHPIYKKLQFTIKLWLNLIFSVIMKKVDFHKSINPPLYRH